MLNKQFPYNTLDRIKDQILKIGLRKRVISFYLIWEISVFDLKNFS